jgi:hypothetical protein
MPWPRRRRERLTWRNEEARDGAGPWSFPVRNAGSYGAEHPAANFCRKHVKSCTFSVGAVVLLSQFA